MTGVLHAQFAKGRATGTTQPDDKQKLESMLKNKIKLEHTLLPYLEAYRYLGWYITMTLDWRKKERKGTPVGVVKEGPAIWSQRPIL